MTKILIMKSRLEGIVAACQMCEVLNKEDPVSKTAVVAKAVELNKGHTNQSSPPQIAFARLRVASYSKLVLNSQLSHLKLSKSVTGQELLEEMEKEKTVEVSVEDIEKVANIALCEVEKFYSRISKL